MPNRTKIVLILTFLGGLLTCVQISVYLLSLYTENEGRWCYEEDCLFWNFTFFFNIQNFFFMVTLLLIRWFSCCAFSTLLHLAWRALDIAWQTAYTFGWGWNYCKILLVCTHVWTGPKPCIFKLKLYLCAQDLAESQWKEENFTFTSENLTQNIQIGHFGPWSKPISCELILR